MRIFRNAFGAGKWAPGAVVAIGKFDGMHLGHQKLIRLAVKRAATLKTRCLVVTFDPSPEQFLRLYSYQPVLTTAQKIGRLKALGVDGVVLLPFNKNLACLSPESFASHILAAQLKVLAVYVGEDFCFGKDRAGGVETLESLGPKLGFSVRPVALSRVAGEKISASKIRGLIERGQKNKAEKLLGWKLNDAP